MQPTAPLRFHFRVFATPIQAVLFLIPLATVLEGCSFPCSNTVSSFMQNPKGPSFAVVFVRDCGATTSWSTNVSILPEPSVTSDSTGNVFIADGGSPQQTGVTIDWTSVRNLKISYSRSLRVFHKVDRVGDVSVAYVEIP